MDEYNKLIEECTNNLPDDSRVVLKSTDWKKILLEIANKYSLKNEQYLKLEELVLFVLLAIEDENDLKQNIENEVLVSSILAEELKNEISDRIFSLIIKRFEDLQEKDKEMEDGDENEADDSEMIESVYIPIPENTNQKYDNLDIPPINLPTEENIPDDFVNNKLNQVVISKKEDIPEIKPAVDQKPISQNPIIKSYTADPYREPVE
jgi:hypothetical protein